MDTCSYCQKSVEESELYEDHCAAGLCFEGCSNSDKPESDHTMQFCKECHGMLYPEIWY